MSNDNEGWAFPGSARKAHYFINTMALCGKWGFFTGPLDTHSPETPSKDDCVACRREYTKRTQGPEK